MLAKYSYNKKKLQVSYSTRTNKSKCTDLRAFYFIKLQILKYLHTEIQVNLKLITGNTYFNV